MTQKGPGIMGEIGLAIDLRRELMQLSKSKQKRRHRKLRRHSPKSWCLVYALQDKGGKLCYVGQTRQLPQDRLHWHYKEIWRRQRNGQRLSPVQRWLEGLGYEPNIVILDRNGIWDISEAVWIDRCRRDRQPLLNVLSVIPGYGDC